VRNLPGPQFVDALHPDWHADEAQELAMYLLDVLIAVDNG
jgi:hypothetical protein